MADKNILVSSGREDAVPKIEGVADRKFPGADRRSQSIETIPGYQAVG